MYSKHTWVVVLELGQVIDITVNSDPKRISLVMRRHVALAESLGHGSVTMTDTRGKRVENGKAKGNSLSIQEGGKIG
jgi:hypothetical protein